MSERIYIKGVPVDIPTAGESPNWAPAVTETLKVIADAINSAVGESVTDLTDANIKVLAGIKATKIEDGSVSSTDYKNISGIGHKNSPNGFAGLDSTGKVYAAQIPTQNVYTAADISNVPANGITSTNVQLAINELQTSVLTKSTIAALSSHQTTTSGIHGVTGSIVGTTDSQTLTNKTLTSPTINTAIISTPSISNGTVTSASIITPVKLEVKQDTKAALDTYASSSTNGQLAFDITNKEYCVVKDSVIKNIALKNKIIDSTSLTLTFKATAIDINNDPIGTYNTFKRDSTINQYTLWTTAPNAGSVMNGNFFISPAVNTAAQPGRYDIFIGKNLKLVTFLTTDISALDVDTDVKIIPMIAPFAGKFTEVGVYKTYNPNTGILSFNILKTNTPSSLLGSRSGGILTDSLVYDEVFTNNIVLSFNAVSLL